MKNERKMGMPEWATIGPIDVKNYNYRAEKHCLDKSEHRGGQHPTLRLDSKELPIWQEYFDQHLGGRPWPFAALMNGTFVEMTIPEPMPQWFDPTFFPMGRHNVVPMRSFQDAAE